MDNAFLQFYSRQMLFDSVGVTGQSVLQAKTVIIAGVGGLGCHVAQALAGSGVGRLILVDHDTVDETNLARQTLFNQASIGQNKAEVAQKTLAAHFSFVDIVSVNRPFDSSLVTDYRPDVLVDCGDNWPLTQCLDGVASAGMCPLVHASVSRFEGISYTRLDATFPALTALFSRPMAEESCSQSGVLTPAVGLLGYVQACQVLRVLLYPTLGEILPQMLLFDGATMGFRTISVAKQ
ncbi:HesA/MoeB/ThiF family protein [Ostreibacterium oceani]|uniref:Molybdopterin-synthase adenylyltransferase MoeB n=1 Tax=Ostreibacterium oceani TaxID=2654998 RepID=A0A6N7EV57_9GAMM|nr:HesA/MoeB/ThiF family protein [Ostreibacterium oceani]MPV85853.1 molybdopterin-synthase adenylyltransferase MoeB [Ostreibacterium oceani]